MAEPERLRPREEPVRPFARHEGVREVAQELIADVGDLLRSEITLARREMKSDVSAMLRGTVFAAVGGLIAFLGVAYLLLAAVFGLATSVGLGWAALIVGAIALIVGGIVAWVGLNRLKSVNPLPEEAIESMREDAEWIRNRMR